MRSINVDMTDVNDMPTANNLDTVIMPFDYSQEFFIEPVGELPKKSVYNFFKRLFDIVASGIALVVLCIPMLVIAMIIKLKSPGTVFYKQERLGLNGKKFSVIKFRTMHMDAEKYGAQWSTGENDPRIFPFGKKLRMSRMDELPQLWCILKGDLSIVGPRPERECFYEEFEKYVHGFSERLKVKPGLTGLAQVSGGYDLRPEEKIQFDIEYIKNQSVLLDIKIIIKTVGVVFSHEGAK